MARKSRKGANETAPITEGIKLYKTAIYARLSIEDCRDRESDSIENQVYLIKQFVSQNPQLKVMSEYIDNGETGTNFDRPAFKRLMDDIRSGKIDCIVVKDLSRFGRNYIETGDYIEKIFPFMGVRFISVNDNYDSQTADSNAEGLILGLKNLINDVYAKDISQKIISSLDTKQRNGEYIGAYAPIGYKKSEEDSHKLVIDEETAYFVRAIFKWRTEGLGYNIIARKLNEMGISSPSKRLMEQGVIKKRESYKTLLWQGQMIKAITNNLIYIGHMAQGKTKKALCDNMPTTKLPQSEWIIIENTHEPLIDMDTWNAVQAIREERKNTFFSNIGKNEHLGNKNNIFKGLVICDDCKTIMMRYKKVSKIGTVLYTFICPMRTQNLDISCPKKVVRERDLLDLVFKAIAKQIELAINMEVIIERLNKTNSVTSSKNEIANKIADVNRQMKRIIGLKASLYESYVGKLLDETEYIYAKLKYEEENNLLKSELEAFQKLSLIQSETLTPQNKWITAFKRFKDEKEVTREMATTLIKQIKVFDYNTVEIVWNYQDEMLALENFIEGSAE